MICMGERECGHRAVRRHGWGVWVVLLALSSPALRAADEPSCAKADALVSAQLLDKAQAAYSEVLAEKPDLACATEGLAAVARAHLARGRAFKAAGDTEEAKKEFQSALRIDTELTAAAEELKKLLADRYAEARKLAALNQQAEAVSKIQETQATHPEEPVPEQLDATRRSLWARWLPWRRWIESWVAVTPFTAALALALVWLALKWWIGLRPVGAAVMLLLAWLALRYTTSLGPVAVAIGFAGVGLLYSLFRRPRLELREFTCSGLSGEIGKDFTPMLRSRLFSLARPGQGDGWLLKKGQMSTIEIPAAVTAVAPGGAKWLQAVPALLGWLSLSRSLELCGELHPPGDHGVGVTVELLQGGRYLSGQTIWQKDFELEPAGDPVKSGDFYALAEVVAVWLLFELVEHT